MVLLIHRVLNKQKPKNSEVRFVVTRGGEGEREELEKGDKR